MPYTYTTYLAARQALALRLEDPNEIFFTDAELKLYLLESLRTFNALTGFWVGDYIFQLTRTSANWVTLNTAGSPRQYHLADTDMYTIILYHIMEPQLSAGTWAGSPQFTVNDLTQAYIRRLNQILIFTSSNVLLQSPFILVPNSRTIILPDTILDVRRVRYINQAPPTPPPPQTLWRGDPLSFQSFTPNYRQTPQTPRNYALSDRPPLTLDVDFPPVDVGYLELLATLSGNNPALPASVPLVIPDDWAWVLKWGMLADLWNKQSEAQDSGRAQYALTRFSEGLELMQLSPWLLSANLNNVPYGIDSVQERDTFDSGWETNTGTRQGIVTAGIDLFSLAVRPTGATTQGVDLELVINAPVPVNDTDNVQVPRDVLDAILDYAVHIAMVKCGGAEFQSTIPLFDSFRTVCKLYNRRIANLGLYDDVMKSWGKRLELADPRYA